MIDIMNLTVEEPKRNLNDYSWTFYGVGGFGKTQLCQYLFDDPAFWQWEQGQNAIRGKKVPVPDGWKSHKGYIKKLKNAYKEGKSMPCKTAIMDTVDFQWKSCNAYVCKVKGIEHASDEEWGKGWEAIKSEFELQQFELENCGIKPVYISHDREKERKPKNGEKYDIITPNVGNGCLETIHDKVDFVGYCVIEKEENEDGKLIPVRRIYFRSDGDFLAKSHLRYFPSVIEYGDSPEECAIRIKKAFEEAVIKEFGKEEVVEPEIAEEEIEDIELIKEEIQRIFKGKLEDGEIDKKGIAGMVREYTGKPKIRDIKNLDTAKELLEVIK